MSGAELDFFAFQQTLLLSILFELAGAALFLWSAKYVVRDRRDAEEAAAAAGGKGDGANGEKKFPDAAFVKENLTIKKSNIFAWDGVEKMALELP